MDLNASNNVLRTYLDVVFNQDFDARGHVKRLLNGKCWTIPVFLVSDVFVGVQNIPTRCFLS